MNESERPIVELFRGPFFEALPTFCAATLPERAPPDHARDRRSDGTDWRIAEKRTKEPVFGIGNLVLYELIAYLLPHFIRYLRYGITLREYRERSLAPAEEDEVEEAKNRFETRPCLDGEVDGSGGDGETICKSSFGCTHVEEGSATRVGDLRGGKMGRLRSSRVLQVTD